MKRRKKPNRLRIALGISNSIGVLLWAMKYMLIPVISKYFDNWAMTIISIAVAVAYDLYSRRKRSKLLLQFHEDEISRKPSDPDSFE